MKLSRIAMDLALVAALCGMTMSCGTSREATADRATSSKPSSELGRIAANPPPNKRMRGFDKTKAVADVTYFYRGVTPMDELLPFERCTRPKDYFIVTLTQNAKTPVMGIRVFMNGVEVPKITEDSFVVVADARVIKPEIRRLEKHETGTWEISWKLEPSWKKIRVDQNISTRFQFDIQNRKPDWSLLPATFVNDLEQGGSGDICPP